MCVTARDRMHTSKRSDDYNMDACLEECYFALNNLSLIRIRKTAKRC